VTKVGGAAGKKKLPAKVGPPVPAGPKLSAHITLASPFVVVPKSYTSPGRQAVTLGADPGFKGSGTFLSSGTAIKFFTLAAGGVEVTAGAGNNVFTDAQLTAAGGVKVFAQGQTASAKLDDVELTLILAAPAPAVGPPAQVGKPAKAKMTAVELTLDVFKTRDAPGSDGAPFPQPPGVVPAPGTATDKWFASRLIHVRSGTRGKRALLVVRAPKPAAFRGKLELRQVVVSGKVIGLPDGKVKLFDTEVGGAAKGNPHEFSATGSDQRFFVEGATLSGGLRDTGFQLGIKGVENDGDRVALTVFSVDKIEAKLRATPCKGNGSRADVMPVKSSVADSKVFDATAITVVRECGDLKLTATVRPAAISLAWDPERAADDAGLVGLPRHIADPTAPADTKKRHFKTNATGSFHIHAFVDVNGNGKRGADEDGIILNVNMVNIEIQPGAPNNRITVRDTLYTDAGSTAAFLVVDSGDRAAVSQGINTVYADALFTQRPLAMRVVVKLTGGGGNQRRGVDKVTLGYIHNFTGDSFKGTYASGSTEKEVFAVIPPPPDTIPVGSPELLLGFPIRDTRAATSNGIDPFIINSTDAEKTPLPGGGQRRIVKFMDRPAVIVHKTLGGSNLVAISGSNDFVAFLCAFSADFDENYTVFARGIWSLTFGSINALGVWTAVGAHTTAAASMDTVGMPKTAESIGVERCPPNAVDNLKMDLR
jgi:hypothetical protein